MGRGSVRVQMWPTVSEATERQKDKGDAIVLSLDKAATPPD